MRNVGITIGGITFLIFMIKMGVDPDNKARYIKLAKNTVMFIGDSDFIEGESVLDVVLQKCQDEVDSALEFEKTLSNPNLYNIVKTLSLREKEVLFYLYKKQKTINEISKIMKIDRTTIWRIRNKAQKKIVEKLVKGEK